MKKVLFVASIDGHITGFHLPYVKWFVSKGYQVDVASKGQDKMPGVSNKYDVDFHRSPLSTHNIGAYRHLKKIIDAGGYELVHCHTPMASVITRIAGINARKKGTKILYTAHGFHFFRGASLKNWCLFYPIEKFFSAYADGILTMNEEDYAFAQKKFKKAKIHFVNGVGVDLSQYKRVEDLEKEKLRDGYGYNKAAVVLVFAGELSYRKNQEMLIQGMSKLIERVPECRLVLAGEGPMMATYKKMISDMGLEGCVDLLGNRSDVADLLKASDIGVSSARQEGLPVNVMEAMASSLPLVVTDCRGNRDLVEDGVNGYVVAIDDVDAFVEAVVKLVNNQEVMAKFAENSYNKMTRYNIDSVVSEMSQIYEGYISQ